LPILAILFRTFGFIAPKVLKLFGFPIFRVVRTKFDIYVFIGML